MNKIFSYILVLVLIAIIVVIAMQFLAPTIGNVYCYHDDTCGGGEGIFYSGLVGHCEGLREGFPRGKLVLIAPKTIITKKIRIIGFAYSPSIYSRSEINEIKQQFLRELRLRKNEANIIEIDIVINEKGYPRIPTYIDICDPEYNPYIKGDNLFIDPDGLTVWYLSYEIVNLQQDTHNINIEFVHDDPGLLKYLENRPGILSQCAHICEHVDGSISIELQKNLSIWGWIQAIWFFRPPFGYIFLILFIALIFYIFRKEIQKKRSSFQLTTKERLMKFDSYGFSGSFSLGAVIGSILGLGLIISGAMTGFSALGVAIVSSAVIGLVIYAIDAALVSILKKISSESDNEVSNGEAFARESTNLMTTTLGKIITGTALATMITTSIVTAAILPNTKNDVNSSQSDFSPLFNEPMPIQTEDTNQDEKNIQGQDFSNENPDNSSVSELSNNESEEQLNSPTDIPNLQDQTLSDYPLVEDFNSSQDFVSTDPDLYIRDGYVYWEVSRSEGVQYIYRPIPPFSGDVKITVTGQIDGFTNNCQVRAGIGDGIQELNEIIHDTGISIHFGFTGGGCPTHGPVVHASGVYLPRDSDGCSPIGSLWVNAGTPITATLTVSDTTTLDIEGKRSLTGTPLYTGEFNTLFVGLTDNHDWPSCWGTIDSIIIEPLNGG